MPNQLNQTLDWTTVITLLGLIGSGLGFVASWVSGQQQKQIEILKLQAEIAKSNHQENADAIADYKQAVAQAVKSTDTLN